MIRLVRRGAIGLSVAHGLLIAAILAHEAWAIGGARWSRGRI